MGTTDADELLAYVPGYSTQGALPCATPGQARPVTLEELLMCPISHVRQPPYSPHPPWCAVLWHTHTVKSQYTVI